MQTARAEEIDAQGLTNIAYGAARSSMAWQTPDAKLFTPLAACAERRIWEFKEQSLANMAWAFATVG